VARSDESPRRGGDPRSASSVSGEDGHSPFLKGFGNRLKPVRLLGRRIGGSMGEKQSVKWSHSAPSRSW
jgi:hypothetical protein